MKNYFSLFLAFNLLSGTTFAENKTEKHLTSSYKDIAVISSAITFISYIFINSRNACDCGMTSKFPEYIKIFKENINSPETTKEDIVQLLEKDSELLHFIYGEKSYFNEASAQCALAIGATVFICFSGKKYLESLGYSLDKKNNKIKQLKA